MIGLQLLGAVCLVFGSVLTIGGALYIVSLAIARNILVACEKESDATMNPRRTLVLDRRELTTGRLVLLGLLFLILGLPLAGLLSH